MSIILANQAVKRWKPNRRKLSIARGTNARYARIVLKRGVFQMPDFSNLEEEDELGAASEDGVTLSLSGGGYRAMMFHVGALVRLNEVGLLGKLTRISSVSGGSITAAFLGLLWDKLHFVSGKATNFSEFIDGMRVMAGTTVDVGAVFGGIFLPG